MNRERGLRILKEMLGEDQAAQVQRAWQEISPDFEAYVIGFLSGEIWARPGLDRRTKSLCTIAALAALGRQRGLDLNIRMAPPQRSHPAGDRGNPASHCALRRVSGGLGGNRRRPRDLRIRRGGGERVFGNVSLVVARNGSSGER